MKILNPKKCKYCTEKFQPFKSIQPFCSIKCQNLYHYHNELKGINTKKTKKKRTSLSEMSRKELLEVAKKEVHIFIRNRDKDEPCISCGITTSNKWDAGHFWAAGNYSFLQFHEDNIHKQCSNNCNIHKGGNQLEYRIRLIDKIGLSRVEWLDENRHKDFVMSNDELRELILEYRHKNKSI